MNAIVMPVTPASKMVLNPLPPLRAAHPFKE